MEWHLTCIRLLRTCMVNGRWRAPGTFLVVDDVLAQRGESNCVSRREAMGLLIAGDAVRPEDERRPRYFTRFAHG